MTRHFVAVGGSGQHVALALADFLVLAHSVTPDPLPPVSFLLLDSDPTSSQTDAASAWQLADQQLRALARVPDRAAGSPIGRPEPAIPKLREGVRAAREALDDVLGVGASRLLLSAEQMDVPVMNGYYGEPRVAAILTDVLIEHLRAGRLPEDHPLRLLQAAVDQSDARICVAGSAIGGTGAGVLPRLVEELGSAANRKAALCALIALQWFKLDGDAEKEERIAANGTASLWHYVQNQATGMYRLLLWGHPQVGQARRERPFGNRSQGAKVDLTAPYYAAAGATAFFFDNETRNERTAPVATPGVFVLPAQLEFTTRIDLGWLIARNHDLLGRLQLLRTYLHAPYRGSVLPFFRGKCRVPEIDAMVPAERAVLAEQIEVIAEAKTRAFTRLRAFASDLRIPTAPKPSQGIPRLRAWFSGRTPSLSVFPPLLDEVVRGPQLPSAARALPSQSTNQAEFAQEPVGTRAPLLATHVDALAQFQSVDAMRIPDGRGIEILLRTAFENPATYWEVNRERLSSLLIRHGGPAVPPELGSLGADDYPSWVQRWFLLLTALCSGNARVQTLDRPILGISQTIVTTVGGDEETPIGYLHPEFVCVPNLAPFWSEASALNALHARVGAVHTYMKPWLRSMVGAGECRYGGDTRPAWSRLLMEALGAAPGGLASADVQRSVLVGWNGAGREVVVPLPRRDESGTPLSDAMASAFGVEIRYLTAPERDFTEEERRAWHDLATHKIDANLVAEDERWHRVRRGSIIWIDQLSDGTRKALDGSLYFHPGRGYAWKMEAGAVPLTLADVLTKVVGVFNPEISSTFAAWPVRTRYAGLVRECETEALNDGTVSVRIRLEGRSEDRRTFPPAQVRRFPRLTIFSWPKLAVKGNSSHSVLFADPDAHFRFRILYGRHYGDLTMASDLMQEAPYTRYIAPQKEGVDGDSAPVVIALSAIEPDGTSTEVGLLPYNSETRRAEGDREQWAVDLGTSSTVIARRAGTEHEATIVFPTENRDATRVYSMGEGVQRSGLVWFPTWHDRRPARSRTTLMPSQIIDMGAASRSYVPADLRSRVYGRDFVLDHGEEIEKAYENAIVDDLKWRRDDKQIFRPYFLSHLLEQSIAMELSARGSLPAELDVTFTLPLRQRDDVGRFAGEIDEVSRVVETRTGIIIRPKYQWESVAIAPKTSGKEDGMIVVADLGGGTLDLYAARFTQGAKAKEAVDSAYLGGHECARILFREQAFGEASFANYLRKLRSGDYDKHDVVSKVPKTGAYFEILYRYIAAWTAALRTRWEVAESTPTDLQLAGLGWSLPGCPDRQSDVAARLTQTARNLGLGFSFQPYGAEPPEAEGRKLRLARNCVDVPGVPASDIISSVENFDVVLGVDVSAGGHNYAATELTQTVSADGQTIRALESSVRRIMPHVSQTDLAELTRRLSSYADAADRKRGAIDVARRTLSVTPLTVLAEIAVSNLVVSS